MTRKATLNHEPSTTERYIGLMSGTSVDGIDAVLLAFCPQAKSWQSLATLSAPLPKPLTEKVHRLSLCDYGDHDPIDLYGETDRELGLAFANAVNQLLINNGLNSGDIKAIGSHGQTVRHRPPGSSRNPFTLQIGDPNIIAWHTGICTIADFRRKDMAAGGQGAPLAPAFHQGLFSSQEHARILVNIGGISNISLLSPETAPKGCDCGPGNTLMDAWIVKHQQKTFDRNGEWARSGQRIPTLLNALKQHPFLVNTQDVSKSSGREEFNLHWLETTLKRLELQNSPPENIQATLAELTAQSIAKHIGQAAVETDQLYVCGGGAFNHYLMERLQTNLPEMQVNTTAKLGIEPNWVEAAGFAWLAKQRLEHVTAGPYRATGAKQPVILGGIYSAQ